VPSPRAAGCPSLLREGRFIRRSGFIVHGSWSSEKHASEKYYFAREHAMNDEL
jgi:hypothetical protein